MAKKKTMKFNMTDNKVMTGILLFIILVMSLDILWQLVNIG
jgi:hypothetical protein